MVELMVTSDSQNDINKAAAILPQEGQSVHWLLITNVASTIDVCNMEIFPTLNKCLLYRFCVRVCNNKSVCHFDEQFSVHVH